MPFDALVLLGCRVAEGDLPPPAKRRVARAVAAYRDGVSGHIIVSGGRTWEGEVEADRLANELVTQGVPRGALLLERESRRTRENARCSARLLRERGWTRIGVVTCDFHLPRALFCFRRAGFDAEPIAAISPELPAPRRWLRLAREQGAWLLDRVGVVLLLATLAPALGACTSGRSPGTAPATSASGKPGADALNAAGSAASRARELLSAELRRASRDVQPTDLTRHDAPTRRAAARALARIADARAAELLLPSLADDDPEVIAWAAYGLGSSCAEREAAHTRALVARAASLRLGATNPPPTPTPGALLDPLSSIADALGRCGGVEAERTLRAWLVSPLAEPAAWALGTLAARRDRLEDATLVALLDAASRREGAVGGALQAFARLGHLDAAVQARLFEVAENALGSPGVARALAIRALGATGERGAAPLGQVVTSAKATPAERADAARALGRLGTTGQLELSAALLRLVDDPATTTAEALSGPLFGVLTSVLTTLTPPPDRAGPALSRLAALEIVGAAALTSRIVSVRCKAAALLAGRGTQSAVLAACDPDAKGRAGRLARLAVLDRGPLKGARLRQWRELAEADDLVVRERALELIAKHDEVADSSALLTRALGAKHGGEVATAAQVLADHPQRAADRPGSGGAGPELTRALGTALEAWKGWPSIEVGASLVDAAAAVGLLSAKPGLEAACTSNNPTLRSHVEKALHVLGDRARHCDTFEPEAAPPAELARVTSGRVHLDLDTTGGTVGLDLDPRLAPIAVTRLVELARAGYYDGVTVHRVVPGFVVQLGDRDGDGYGGADRPPLRCETSPAHFDTGSVGIALAGRDTGSSQFFVTLGRAAHLDGEYALVGQAGPGWDCLAEGDVVRTVRAK